jgi:hypothetical protein
MRHTQACLEFRELLLATLGLGDLEHVEAHRL